MTPERRTRRSEQPAEAARLFLDADARRNGYASLTLADADGLVVVNAPTTVNTEAVAAVAPFADGDGDGPSTEGLLDFVTRGQALRVRSFEMHGDRLFLAAVGGERQPGPGAEAAMRRILGTASVLA